MTGQEQGQKNTNHTAILENRKTLLLTGITEVDSFDEHSVSLYTQLGELLIRGNDLRVNALNVETGDLSVEGDIWALCYGEKDKKKPLSFLGKLFR